MPGTGLRGIYASALMPESPPWLADDVTSPAVLFLRVTLFSLLPFLLHCSTLYFPFVLTAASPATRHHIGLDDQA